MKYLCPCCNQQVLREKGENTYEICSVCGWEQDAYQLHHPDSADGANRISLNQARKEYADRCSKEQEGSYRILIVEDDAAMAGLMKKQLESWGYQVRLAEDFQKITEEFAAYEPQLVLLDIMLPFYNGYHWCSEIRRFSQVPIIFISSASDNMNIVMAMNMGADDFLPKPIDLSVMTAKIQAVLRRSYQTAQPASILSHRGAVLNLNDASLAYQGQTISLTKNEYRILQTLMEHTGKVVSRDTLMTRLWQMDSYVEENTLTVNVNRLRRKLEEAGLTGFIQTKTGVGYLIP